MEHGLILDIAICIVAAWIVAVICQALRQPLIIAYLAAGFAIGPRGFQLVTDPNTIQTISAIGLILLLFMIGLEMDLQNMLTAGKAITLTGTVQIGGCILLGGLFFHFTHQSQTTLETAYLAVAVAMSSTVIIVKILHDKRELETLAGSITVGILVLQDLMVILFLAIQPNLRSPELSQIGLALGKVLLLVGLAYGAGRFILPPIFKMVARQPELVLVGALAWCFAMSGFAGYLGLSREMGALLAGVMVSTFPYTLDVVAKVTSIRDFFVTLFFVGLGMTIPVPTPALLGSAVLLGLFIIVVRFVTVFPVLHWMKLGHRVSLLPAINLSQLSELSLVLLTLGKATGDVSENSLSIAAFAFAFLAIESSYTIHANESIVPWLSRILSRLGIGDLPGAAARPLDANQPKRIFLLGFSWTASSLLEEIAREKPTLLPEIQVVDFNPRIYDKLKRRGVSLAYGDISQRDVLIHSGVANAEIIICSLPDTVLKGTSNLKLLRQLRELNPNAHIIVHAEKLSSISILLNSGANYVTTPRLLEAADLFNVLDAVEKNLLEEKRNEQAAALEDRDEVIP